jgi:hypothetical protein
LYFSDDRSVFWMAAELQAESLGLQTGPSAELARVPKHGLGSSSMCSLNRMPSPALAASFPESPCDPQADHGIVFFGWPQHFLDSRRRFAARHLLLLQSSPASRLTGGAFVFFI